MRAWGCPWRSQNEFTFTLEEHGGLQHAGPAALPPFRPNAGWRSKEDICREIAWDMKTLAFFYELPSHSCQGLAFSSSI
jgi:hypothetical protein